MRILLMIAAALSAVCGSARAQSLVSNPLILPSATFTTGNCIQATGTNSIASTGAPCGTGGGGGTVSGPTSSTIGAIAVWSDGAGTKLGDSTILPANLPTLGASQTWGGINSYAVRPIFNGATPFDTLNLNPALFLTITAAQQTYATITGVQSAYLPFTGGTMTGPLTLNNSLNINGASTSFKGTHFTVGNVLRWNSGVDDTESGTNTGSDYHIYAYNDSGVLIGTALAITRSTLVANFGVRPTFAGNLAFDAGNFNPALYLTIADAAATYTTPAEVDAALVTFLTKADAASTYLTQANAASTYLTQANAASTYLTIVGAQQTYATISGVESAFLRITDAALTYFPLAGGKTITGSTQFNQIPVINAAIPPVTDSSGDVASSAWTQAVITARVGTNGPFIPTSGVGMPYDIHFPWTGPNVPTTPLPSAFDVLRYTFARKVVIPISFAGAIITCINNATNATVLEISRTGSVNSLVGTILFTPGSSKGVPTISSGTTTTFLPGDQLVIFTNSSASNPAIADATLNGISGTIVGTISN